MLDSACLDHSHVHELLAPCLGVCLEKEKSAFFFLREMSDIIVYFVSAKSERLSR